MDLISIDIDKEPFIKKLSNDKIINLTGQSGSGKSTYAQKMFNGDDYIIIDTDVIFGNHCSNNKLINEFKEYINNKYSNKNLTLEYDFDLIYKEILNYFKKFNKTIVIDCAQFHCIKDITILKGEIIVIRTSIDNCYKRCVERYLKNKPNCTKEELEKYKERKKKIYDWYHETNNFLEKINLL